MSTEIKKYLDAEGLQYLWSKINMQDYPNNDVLIAVINAIDENKADKELLYELTQAITLDRIDEICDIQPVMTLVVDESDDAMINAG